MKTHWTSPTAGIRRWRDSDASPLEEAVRESETQLRQGMQWLAVYGPDWIERTRKMWRDRESYNFGLFDAASREIAGSVWLSQIRWLHGCANLGYWVRTSMAGRGLATAGVRFIARFGFEDLRLHRLEILVATDNRASMRVARKAGAVREGILRERLRLEGQYHDAVLFSLLPCDTRRQR